jgi:hypothetical protein
LFGVVAGLLWTERQRQKAIAHEANMVRRGICAELANIEAMLTGYQTQLMNPTAQGQQIAVAADFSPSFFETAVSKLPVLTFDEIGPVLAAFNAKSTFVREIVTHGTPHPTQSGYYLFAPAQNNFLTSKTELFLTVVVKARLELRAQMDTN